MLQTLSIDINECYLHAEQCRRWAEMAPTPTAKVDFLDMERRWLSLAHNYELQNSYRIPRTASVRNRNLLANASSTTSEASLTWQKNSNSFARVKRFRIGAISIGSDPLCSWPLGTTRDDCGECSTE
jgi:hypothetical protein